MQVDPHTNNKDLIRLRYLAHGMQVDPMYTTPYVPCILHSLLACHVKVTIVVVCSLTSIQEARGNVPIIYWSASAP